MVFPRPDHPQLRHIPLTQRIRAVQQNLFVSFGLRQPQPVPRAAIEHEADVVIAAVVADLLQHAGVAQRLRLERLIARRLVEQPEASGEKAARPALRIDGHQLTVLPPLRETVLRPLHPFHQPTILLGATGEDAGDGRTEGGFVRRNRLDRLQRPTREVDRRIPQLEQIGRPLHRGRFQRMAQMGRKGHFVGIEGHGAGFGLRRHPDRPGGLAVRPRPHGMVEAAVFRPPRIRPPHRPDRALRDQCAIGFRGGFEGVRPMRHPEVRFGIERIALRRLELIPEEPLDPHREGDQVSAGNHLRLTGLATGGHLPLEEARENQGALHVAVELHHGGGGRRHPFLGFAGQERDEGVALLEAVRGEESLCRDPLFRHRDSLHPLGREDRQRLRKRLVGPPRLDSDPKYVPVLPFGDRIVLRLVGPDTRPQRHTAELHQYAPAPDEIDHGVDGLYRKALAEGIDHHIVRPAKQGTFEGVGAARLKHRSLRQFRRQQGRDPVLLGETILIQEKDMPILLVRLDLRQPRAYDSLRGQLARVGRPADLGDPHLFVRVAVLRHQLA